MVSFTLFAAVQTVTAWQPAVHHAGETFAMTEMSYKLADESHKMWKNENTITFEAAAARCLSHGDDCVGFFREDKDGAADTGFIHANAVVLEDGKNIDSANITHAYYNRSFTPANGKVQSAYTGLCLEAVPINEFVMKIEKKECAPTDMQRWLINDTAMVFDGGVGRSFYVAPTKDADWQGAELFAWDAVARPVHDMDFELEYTDDGLLKFNLKWNHKCAFTDSEENKTSGFYLYDCNSSPAQQYTIGFMEESWYSRRRRYSSVQL